MRTTLLTLSIVVFVFSLLIGGFFLWRIKPLGLGTFPAVVNHLPLTEGPKYLDRDKVYTAFYGNKTNGILFSVKQLPSADESAAFVRGQRESIVINQAKAATGDNYARPSEFTKFNDEKSGVLAYTQGELSNVIWADGNRVDYVFGSETYQVEEAAAAFRGQPTLEGITLYGLMKDLPFQLRHWLGVIIPAIFAGIALLLMLVTVIIGHRKKSAISPAVS